MKWLSVLLVTALAVLSNACEMHPASELPAEEGAGESHAEAAKEETKPAEAAAPAEAPKPADDSKPGEPPKFFPEKK